MEPNTSSSAAAGAAGTFAAASADNKDLTPEQVQTLISLLLTPLAMPSLVSAPDCGCGLSWDQLQMLIASSVEAVGGRYFVPAAVHAHASSSQQASTSMLPAVGELPVMADGFFACPEAPAASTPVLPTLLGGQPGLEGLVQPSTCTAPGLPQISSEGVLEFASQSAASGEIAAWQDMPLFSPSFASDLLPLPLPQSSDDDDMVGIIPQPSSDYELAPLPASLCIPSLPGIIPQPSSELAPLPESLCIPSLPVVSTDGGIMPWNCGGSSMDMDGLGSSISSVPTLTTEAMNPPMLPALVEASFQGAGTSSNFVGFGEQSSISESELAPAVPSLQVPPVMVNKEQPVDATTATLRGPEFTSLVDDGDEDELDLEALLNLFPDLEGLPEDDDLDLEAIENMVRDLEGLPVPDTSCSLVGGGPSSENVVAVPEKNAISTMGSSSCAQSTHCHDGNVSMDVDTSSSAAKQTCSRPPLPPSSTRAGASSSRRYATIGINIFTDAEMEIILKDRHLKERWFVDPKRVKRIVYNRMSAAKAKARIVNHTVNLERRVKTLEMKRKTLCEQLQSLEDGTSELKSQHMDMMIKKEQLEEQTKLKDALYDLLKLQIQNLNLITINALQMMSSEMPGGSTHQEISPLMVELQPLQVQEQSTEQQHAHAEHVDDTFMGDQHNQDF